MNDLITVFLIQACITVRDQILPCLKIGEGQPRVIIYLNVVEFDSPKQYTKLQDHRTFGSGEDLLNVLTFWSLDHSQYFYTFMSPLPKELAPKKK